MLSDEDINHYTASWREPHLKEAGMSETEALHSERGLLPPRVGSLDLEVVGLSLEGRVRWPLSEEMGGREA